MVCGHCHAGQSWFAHWGPLCRTERPVAPRLLCGVLASSLRRVCAPTPRILKKPCVTWIVLVLKTFLKTLAPDVEVGSVLNLSKNDHLFFFVSVLGELRLLEFHLLEWPQLGTAARMTHTERVYLYVQGNLCDGGFLSTVVEAYLGGAHLGKHTSLGTGSLPL